MERLRERIEAAGMPEEALTQATRELDRLASMQTAAAEYGVIRTYLEWMAELPWSKSSDDRLDVEEARRILDEDHYGLDRVKDRIVEFIAVLSLKRDLKGPILCFVGPPGTGKTSLGRSIARALGREFQRISLGGVRDEAEIRGHRRTYVGALPGRLVQGLRRAGTRNPVFILDEVDKVGADFRGDPSSALLEVLDPEQNSTFSDHYLEVPFDLSQVLFIATANVMDPVPAALRRPDGSDRAPGLHRGREGRDRPAVPGAAPTPAERGGQDRLGDSRRHAARHHPRLHARGRRAKPGAGDRRRGPEDRAPRGRRRTGGAGASSAPRTCPTCWDPCASSPRSPSGWARPVWPWGWRGRRPGATSCSWNRPACPGKGKLKLTGLLGDVMRESVEAARSWLRSHASDLGIDRDLFAESDLHLHVPAGGVPKDGPSAGIAMVTSLSSLLSGRPARPDVAMTGEITLRGKVLPVGGIKEKVLAAKRAGIARVVLPELNRRDVEEIPAELLEGLELEYVGRVDEALQHTLALDALSESLLR